MASLPRPKPAVDRSKVCFVWINTPIATPSELSEIRRWCSEKGVDCVIKHVRYLGDSVYTFTEARRMCGNSYMVLVALVPLKAVKELVEICRATEVCEVWQPQTAVVAMCRSREECRDVIDRLGSEAIINDKRGVVEVRRFLRFVRVKSVRVEVESVWS